jgi:hypothetical protein
LKNAANHPGDQKQSAGAPVINYPTDQKQPAGIPVKEALQ